MSSRPSDLYNFVYRGLLAEQALDNAGRHNDRIAQFDQHELAKTLALDILDEQHVSTARAMSVIYVAVAAFENSVRALISSVLLEQCGENWWSSCVSEKIRTRAEQKRLEEEKHRWHVKRGADPIYYTQMPDLSNILRQNWTYFEPYIPSVEWAVGILEVIERSRNVIMHSGVLQRADVERIGIYIRDWVKQVGA